jgi:hypothetical protein
MLSFGLVFSTRVLFAVLIKEDRRMMKSQEIISKLPYSKPFLFVDKSSKLKGGRSLYFR